MFKVRELKTGIFVLIFGICLAVKTLHAENESVSDSGYSSAQSQLLETLKFDSKSEEQLRAYLETPSTSVQNRITFLIDLLKQILKTYDDSSKDHENYSTVQHHLQMIFLEFTALLDKMTGEQIATVMKTLKASDLMVSEEFEKVLTKFYQTIIGKEFSEENLPIELNQVNKTLVLNKLVGEGLSKYMVGNGNPYYGQEEAYKKILGTLIRPNKHFPIIVEPHLSGKTSFLLDMTRRLRLRYFPPNVVFQRSFKDALVLEWNAQTLKTDQLETSLAALVNFKSTVKRPIILVIENLHLLTGENADSLLDLIDFIHLRTDQRLKFIGTTTPEGWKTIIKAVKPEILEDLFQQIEFAPLSEEHLAKIGIEKLATNPKFVKELGVTFENAAIKKLAQFVAAQKNSKQTPIWRMRRALEDAAIYKLSEDPFGSNVVTATDVRLFLNKQAGIKFNIEDPEETAAYYAELESQISEYIGGQERVIRELLDLHRDLMANANSQRRVRVVGILGPTGVGKTELAKTFGRFAYGHSDKVLRIDGTAYMDKNNLFKLTGPTIGYKDSEQKGILIEYLDGPGANGGKILIDEGGQACSEFWQAIMTLIEDGFIVGGDGKPRFLHNNIIEITTNRGDKQLYPKGFDTWPKEQQEAHLNSFKQDKLKALFTESTGRNDDKVLPDYVVQRIDRFVAANPARLDVALKFIPKLAARMKESFYESRGKIVEISEQLLEDFVRINFKSAPGYRPLFRTFEYSFRKIIMDSLATMSAKDHTLKLENAKNGKGERVVIAHILDSGKSLEFEFPSVDELTVFQDPSVLERLTKLPDVVKENLIGQDHIIEPLVAAIQKHILRAKSNRRPLTFFNIGPTGTGKTELTKVLALGLMGSSDRTGLIPLGEIKSQFNWTQFFGGDGTDMIRPFEKFLQANPQGGVLGMDEASNLGGNDLTLKNELFKLLYNMIDEGKWVSPTTGIEYDLSKYIFVFTGNDGQELYEGAADEHLREKVWKEFNHRHKIEAILKKAGVPEAFIGRMAALFWARPANKMEMATIARKFLKAQQESLDHRHIKFEYTDDFVTDLVNYSYSVMMGARSVRNFVENVIGGLLAQIELKSFENKFELSGTTIRLSFGNSQKQVPFTNAKTKSNPKVAVTGTVENNGQIILEHSLDAKSFLAPHTTQTSKEAWSTALHESGHGITNDYTNSGMKVSSITIAGSGGYLGYASYDHDENESRNYTRKRVIARIAGLLAGGLAQQMGGLELDSGWASDLEKARMMATEAVVQWGLGKELDSVFYPQQEEKKPQINEEVLRREVHNLMMEGYQLSKQTLSAHWRHLLLVAKTLMGIHTIDKGKWEALKKERFRGKVEWELLGIEGIDRMRPVLPPGRAKVGSCALTIGKTKSTDQPANSSPPKPKQRRRKN